ncbi:TPA: hypothetical protein JD366_002289 [Citrobacter amalonaticus]|nr:hypothetical protein [Citrobacter amalonaticus]
MGYKHKATMYYSDDETHAFLQDKAAKPNGKKSASQYLYSLVTRERENAVSAESQQDVPCMVRMYPQYTRIQWRQFSGPVSFPAVTGVGKNKTAQTRLGRKDLMEAIDREINKDSHVIFLKKRYDFLENGGFLVIIKSEVTCYYSDEITMDGQCRGFFNINYGVIYVSESEWKLHGGKYDFENIIHMNFRDLSNPQKNKHSGLCQIAETHPRDTSGAFFIPVRKIAKTFPSDRNPYTLITGVDISFRQDRVKLKAMNETQKKINFGKAGA